MNNFRYFMPADCYFGRGCIDANKNAMVKLGKKAMDAAYAHLKKF